MRADTDVLELARTDRRSLIDLERLTGAIVEADLDAVLASSSANVSYTGGSFIDYPPLLTLAVTTADGEQALIINEADAIYFREYSWVRDIRSYPYMASIVDANREAIRLTAELLREVAKGPRLGIEETHLPILYQRLLAEELPDCEMLDASSTLERVRVVKTPAEIELLRYAAQATEKAVATGFALARPGDTEQQLAATIQSAAVKLGADGLDHADCHAGAHAAIVHAWPMAKQLEPDEVIHVDFGAIFGGYRTDHARNAVVGASEEAQDRFYSPLFEAQQRVIEAMRPGVAAGELHSIGMRAIEDAGLTYPWGTLGHSIGLSIHEGFEIVAGSEVPLQENMVVNVEPSHIEAADARYHIEDTVRITATGAERLCGVEAGGRLTSIR